MTQKQKETKIKLKKYVKYLNVLLVALIIVSSISYIVSINNLSIKGFVLNELKTEFIVLANENENYEVRAMDLESLNNLKKRAENLKMVKINDIEYFTISSGAMAKK